MLSILTLALQEYTPEFFLSLEPHSRLKCKEDCLQHWQWEFLLSLPGCGIEAFFFLKHYLEICRKQEKPASFFFSVQDWRGERCGFTSAAQKDVPLLAGETLERRCLLWELIQCMTWRDLDSFSGKNLFVLKCHDVDFNGELLVRVASEGPVDLAV